MSIAYWSCAVVTAASSCVSFAFSVAALRGAAPVSAVASRYALVRSAAFALPAIAALCFGSMGFLSAMAIVMIVVQAGDALVGATVRDRMKTIGPAIIAAINLAVLVWLLAH
jgi:hypothetical protein